MNATNGQSVRRLTRIALLAFLATIGFDLFLHAGVLAPLYAQPDSFLLAPREAFFRIPIGYASFMLLIALVTWLMPQLRVIGLARGLRFGLIFGMLVWGSFVLGLASISTAPTDLLFGWFVGQTLEFGVIGLVVGGGLARANLKPLAWKVLVFAVVAAAIGIAIQNALGVRFSGA